MELLILTLFLWLKVLDLTEIVCSMIQTNEMKNSLVICVQFMECLLMQNVY